MRHDVQLIYFRTNRKIGRGVEVRFLVHKSNQYYEECDKGTYLPVYLRLVFLDSSPYLDTPEGVYRTSLR